MKAWRAFLFLLLLVWSATGLLARGYDVLGSVRYLTDATGVITDTFTYDAFGILIDRRARTSGGILTPFANPAIETPPAGTTPTVNNYRYTGEQWDPDLGMDYLRARYYRPELGRFWTMDTFEGLRQRPGTLHKYTYCGHNPANRTDPSGHLEISLPGQLIVAGGLLAITTWYYADIALHRAGPMGWPTIGRSYPTREPTTTSQPEEKPKPLPVPPPWLPDTTDDPSDDRFICFHYSQSPPLSFESTGLVPPAFVTEVTGLDSKTAMFDFSIAPPFYEYAFKIRLDMLGPANNSNPGRRIQYPVIKPTGAGSMLTWRYVPQTHGR